MEESHSLYSTHMFMFPFVFEEETEKVNKALLDSGAWEERIYDPGASAEAYSSYSYFYEYVRKALFGVSGGDTGVSSLFFYKDQVGEYVIEVSGRTYTLDIESITLRTFVTGVGILSFGLTNRRYQHPEDILMINEFGRRLYPQYLDAYRGLDGVKGNLLADRITLKLSETLTEDFGYYADMGNISRDPTHLPAYIHGLLGERFSSEHREDTIVIEPIIDDRMFVMSMYMNDALAGKLSQYDPDLEQYAYEEDGYWYRYLFVDTSEKMCQSRHMTKALIHQSTYDRWVEWGTLFGISRYSFVALTTRGFGEYILQFHMRTMYFQISTLLLAYRASMLNFSRRVSEVTVGEMELPELQKRVTMIYKDYINFENNLFFRELTAQEQGIELYSKALDVMQTEKHIKDLDSEIAELHTYVSMRMEQEQVAQAEKREEELEKISKLGAIFLPPTVIAGILGVNTVAFAQNDTSMWIGGVLILLSALAGYIFIKTKGWLRGLAGVVLIGCVLFALFGMPKDPTTNTTGNNSSQSTTKEKHDVIKPVR